MNLNIEKGRKFRVAGYELIQRLGTGARSAIWEAREKETGRIVALKRTFKQHGDDDRYFEQAMNEYEIGSRLQHPSIRKVFSLQKVRSLFSVRELHTFLELCRGNSLEKQRPETFLEACSIFVNIAGAMHEMNNRGYVHADMKPENIVVDEKGHPKIIDLGLSCRMGVAKARIQGTPDYMAPEQLIKWPLDARTDVYNFGATMYWTFTGEAPPTVIPHQEHSISKGQKVAVPAQVLNPRIPEQLSRMITDCIQIEPSARLGGMDAILNRLHVVMRELERNPDKAEERILDPDTETDSDPGIHIELAEHED
ncbi:MAG: serine/threonine protein kinase [Phycisphaerae bacterium]|nr:serine/threonine protein kinase [Phycisphaerae bacterium]